MSRCVTSDFDISSVKMATGTSAKRTARFAAMPSPSADFPMLGRAARMIRLPSWKPDVMPVEVAEAGGDAGDLGAQLVQGGDALEALLEQLLDVAELALCALLREVEEDLLGLVDELVVVAGPLPAEAGDLAARRG